MSFKSSEHINEKKDGPYHGFGYLGLFSDPIDSKLVYESSFFLFIMVVIIIYLFVRDDPLTR